LRQCSPYRNTPEALFSAVQVGNKLGLDGAARTHTAKEPTVDALFSVALMMRSARLLAYEREQRGLGPSVPAALLRTAVA
jgi:hypothetical protein